MVRWQWRVGLLATTLAGVGIAACESAARPGVPSAISVIVSPAGLASPQTVTPSNSTPTPSAVFTVPLDVKQITLTEADSDRSLVLHVGQRIDIRLGGDAPPYSWSPPQGSDEHVLHTLSTSTGAGGSAESLFVAIGRGGADLTATNSCAPPCTATAYVWKVSVAVM